MTEAVPGRHVHLEACETFQQMFDTHQVVQGERTFGIVGDQYVEIAVQAFVSPRSRPEYGERSDPLPSDFVSMRLQARNERRSIHSP